jgi:hypothetical protein
MPCASVLDGLPDEGVECLLGCLKADGSMVEVIGYLQDGEWVIETDHLEEWDVRVRHRMPLASARKRV